MIEREALDNVYSDIRVSLMINLGLLPEEADELTKKIVFLLREELKLKSETAETTGTGDWK